jgi:uncharacterized protein (TIGR00251 family)
MVGGTGIRLAATKEGTVIPIRAVPRARRSCILGEYGGSLRVAVAAPPEGGKANRVLLATLAEILGLPPTSLEIRRGAASKDKLVLARGADADDVAATLRAILASMA